MIVNGSGVELELFQLELQAEATSRTAVEHWHFLSLPLTSES